MSVITVTSLKGGVGKTTSTIHIAHGLARAGYQTLLIDCDVASNASRFFGAVRSPGDPGVLDLFRPNSQLGVKKSPDRLTLSSVSSDAFVFDVRPHLDLVPGTRSMQLKSNLELEIMSAQDFFLSGVLGFLKESYSFVVIDTSPDLNILTRNALASADLVIIPVDAGAMSIEAVDELLKFHSPDQNKTQTYILRTMLNRSASKTNSYSQESLSQKIEVTRQLNGARTAYPLPSRVGTLETSIYRTELANQIGYMQKTAFDLTVSNTLANDYFNLVNELIYLEAMRNGNKPKHNISPINIGMA